MQTLSQVVEWKGLHHYASQAECACNSIAPRDDRFVSVGEDGRLNLVHMEHRNPIATIGQLTQASSD